MGQGLPAPEGVAVLDGRGHLGLPGLVDAHAHLDKTLWGLPWWPHSAGEGGLAALIENEHRGRSEPARSGVTVAERTRALGLAGKVTVSHAFALAEIPEQRLDGLGCDGIRDLWSPWGDVLARAALLAWRAGARRDEDPSAALEVATSGGAPSSASPPTA